MKIRKFIEDITGISARKERKKSAMQMKEKAETSVAKMIDILNSIGIPAKEGTVVDFPSLANMSVDLIKRFNKEPTIHLFIFKDNEKIFLPYLTDKLKVNKIIGHSFDCDTDKWISEDVDKIELDDLDYFELKKGDDSFYIGRSAESSVWIQCKIIDEL